MNRRAKSLVRRGGLWLLYGLLILLLPYRVGAQIVSKVEMAGEKSQMRSLLMRQADLLPSYQLPAFDVDSARVAMITESVSTRLYHFAHPVQVDIDPIAEGAETQLPDGTHCWRYRITSPGAKSLCLFFDRFELPEGGLLYLYDSRNPQHRIGGFGAENNNRDRMLQVQPIATDEVTIEVQAPRGRRPILHLAEVTHGVRAIPINQALFDRYDRSKEKKKYYCTPELACFPSLKNLGNGVVLVLAGGTTFGTGSLVNNTKADGRPLILTAAHVVSKNFAFSPYTARQEARHLVVFFGYASPTCSGDIVPQITQSLSGSELLGESRTNDLALLEMFHPVPASYDATYLGWSAEERPRGPFTGIHHPLVCPKKVSTYDGESLEIGSYPGTGMPFEPNQHYIIPSWTMGTTDAGSSGSPLFDHQMLIIGALTSGNSYCTNKSSDQYSSLAKLWKRNDREAVQIINALDPSGKRQTSCPILGKNNPHHPLTKRSVTNITLAPSASIGKELLKLPMKQLLGQEQGVTNIAERYKLRSGTTIHQVTLYVEISEVKGIQKGTTLELALYDLQQGVLLKEWTMDLSSVMPPPNKKFKYLATEPLILQLQSQIPDKGVQLTNDGEYLISLNSSRLPEGMKLLHQLHDNAERSTLFWLRDGQWQKASELATINASSWIDLEITHPLIDEEEAQKQQQKSITMRHVPQSGLFFQASDLSISKGKIEVYTPLGELLLKEEFAHHAYFLPRAGWEQYGMLIIRVTFGDQSETFKVLFTS